MFTVSKKIRISAAHSLPYVPREHKCSLLHGHNYVVTLVLEAENLDEYGFVEDFGSVGRLLAEIVGKHDHTFLNEAFSNPTAENLARGWGLDIKEHLSHVGGVHFRSLTVQETEDSSATYFS